MEGKTRATIEDLYRAEGKAEFVQGEIVEMPPAGMIRAEQVSEWQRDSSITKNVQEWDGHTRMGPDSTSTFPIGKL